MKNYPKIIKWIFIVLIIILVVIINYFLSHKYLVEIKEIPALYKVIKIIDGDTITVEINNQIETVRLLGIDTPEIPNSYKPKGCFGTEANQKTKELLENKNVYLVPDPLSSNRDKYNRLLRYIFLENGYFINAELLKEGYAYNYIYEPFQFMKEFNRLENLAKTNKIGLWLKCR